MDKAEMIEKLINDDIDTIKNSRDDEYIYNILRFGIGYDHQALFEIKQEFESRTWEGDML
jgi:hypothetical protein